MAKKRLNKKLAMIGSVLFVFMAITVIVGLLYLSRRNPQKFIKYGDEAIATARQTTDKEHRKELYKEAERDFKKAYGYSKTDELKIVGLYHLADLYIETEDWRNVMGCWAQIVRLDPKDVKVRYNRLKYFYIYAQTVSGQAWQDVATQAGELIEMIEAPGATAELATEDTSKLEIEAFKQNGEPTHKLGPYLHLIRGLANLQIAIIGMVTNKEETLKQAVADLEKVKQLEPANPDVYHYLARAIAFSGSMEASKGNQEAKTNSQKDAIELLKEGIKATKDDIKAYINFLDMKHNFSFAQASETPSDQKKQLLEMEPEYLSLTAKFGSKAEAFSTLASFYSDYRLGPAYLDKAIEAAEKAVELDKNNVDYVAIASSLHLRRFHIKNQNTDLNKAIELTQNALLLPDTQETTGPRSEAMRANRLTMLSILASIYIDQIMDANASLRESEGQQLLTNVQQTVRQIEQYYRSGDDPQVAKWQGMVELATARLKKSDFSPAIQKLYKSYTQLKAAGRSDPRLSYRLAKMFAYGIESGAVSEFLGDALQNGIESTMPEARLEYAELLVKYGVWKIALSNIDLFEERYGITDRSRILRTRAYIVARDFVEAERYLDQIPQSDPSWRQLKALILETKASALHTIIVSREEKPRTSTVLMNTLSQKSLQPEVDQRSNEQLAAEMKTITSTFIENLDAMLSLDPNSLEVTLATSMCDNAIANGNLDQANLIIEKYLKYQPDNVNALYYKRLLAEPTPAKLTPERVNQLKEDTLAGVADPLKRAISLGFFYTNINDSNKALEQFKKLAPAPIGTGELQPDDSMKRRVIASLFDIELVKKDWDAVDKILQITKRENYDDCSGNFFAARAAYAKEQYETALASIDSALSQRPVFGYGYLLRSRIDSALGNEAAALADISMASKTTPLDKTVAREYAIRLYKRNQVLGDHVSTAQLAETKSALNWAMALNQGDVQLMSFYAEYISENDPNRALALRQSLQENMPSMQNALLLARLATKLGLENTDPQRRQALLSMAFAALGQAKSYDPQSPVVLDSYAEYYRLTGQPQEAEKLLKESKDSQQLLWRFYIKTGRYDDARKSLEQHYQTNPKDINALEGLLFIAEATVDKASATKYGEQLLSATDTPEIHLLVIQTYLNTGLIKEAEQKLSSFREKYPQEGKGLMLSSWLSMKQGRLKEALELINKRLESNQSDATAWQLRGQINSMMANYDLAITDLKQSKTLLDAAMTRIMLAKIYIKTGRTDDAAIELKGLVEDQQAPDEARTMLEQIYSQAGRKESLDDFYSKVLKQFPESVYWLRRAGGFAGNTGDFATAENLYETALRKSIEQGQPSIDALSGYLRAILAAGKMDKLFEEAGKYIDGNLAPVAYLKMAEGKMKLGDRITAVQYCKKAIEKAGNDEAIAAQILEKVYGLIGEQETEQLCKQKLDMQPESPSANWAMYNVCRLKTDYSKAIEYLDKCAKVLGPDQPQQVTYKMQKAETLLLAFTKTSDNKYLNDAIGVYESLLEKMPNNTNILNNVAYILATNNHDLDKALEYAKRAHEIQPDEPDYLDTYALVLYKKGNYAESLQAAQTSIQLYEAKRSTPPVEAYEHLAQAYEQLGELTQAHVAYRQALSAGGDSMKTEDKDRINTAIERLEKNKDYDKKGQ